jgi:adenylylsulfate reductase subunit B
MCPQGAIEMRGYADVMPMGSRVTPLRGTDSIMWAIQFRDGTIKRFKYPIRTTPWGSIDATMGMSAPTEDDFSSQRLHGEPMWLKVDALPGLPT